MRQNRTGWQNVHTLAVTSISIVLGPKVSKTPWPFMVAEAATAAQGQAKRACAAVGASAVARSIPHGNHGDTLRSAKK